MEVEIDTCVCTRSSVAVSECCTVVLNSVHVYVACCGEEPLDALFWLAS